MSTITFESRRFVLATMLLAASAAVLSACRKEDADIRADPDAKSSGDAQGSDGTRLKMITHVGQDGSRAFGGWYDTKLQKRCTHEIVGGASVCVPEDVFTIPAAAAVGASSSRGTLLYSDSKCDTLVGVVIPSYERACATYGIVRTAPFLTGTTQATCQTTAASYSYSVTRPIPPGTTLYRSYGSCSVYAPTAGSDENAWLIEPATKERLQSVDLVVGEVEK
ncbi:MAG: hypothetical protein JNL38_19480 [Myxococcales bacterium]|jgi:hypothetical protein|nr:hypothetical protein [Myxococcales bacterium]